MYNHIRTSIIGSHQNIQDATRYYEDDSRIIAVVADGLGSCKKSADGARLICKLIIHELQGKRSPLEPNGIASLRAWYECLEQDNHRHDDYCTTCSFVLIDKIARQVSVGQIGDSPLFVQVDDSTVFEMRQHKEFSNVTDCLGGTSVNSFTIQNYEFKDKVNILVASDGIGDELDSSSLDSLFSYLNATYGNYSRKSRSRRFTKEMKNSFGKVNHDDKSAIYIWKT